MWQTHNSHSILSDWWDCGQVLCPCSILQVLSPSTWFITVSCAPHSFPLKTALNQLDIPSQQISNLESASKITHPFFLEISCYTRVNKHLERVSLKERNVPSAFLKIRCLWKTKSWCRSIIGFLRVNSSWFLKYAKKNSNNSMLWVVALLCGC